MARKVKPIPSLALPLKGRGQKPQSERGNSSVSIDARLSASPLPNPPPTGRKSEVRRKTRDTPPHAAIFVIPSSIGSEGSRDHSFHDPKYIFTSSYPASFSARNVFDARAPLKQYR